MTASLLQQAVQLPVADRIQLVEDLWNSIAEDEAFPLSTAQQTELDRRLDEMEREPARGVDWETAKEAIRRRRQ